MSAAKWVGFSLALGVFAPAAPAEAKLLDLYGQIGLGAGGGAGLSGVPKDDAFFGDAAGAQYGFRLGAEVLFVDAFVDHWQFTDFAEVTGTWTQFMLGFDLDFEVGTTPPPGQKAARTYAEIGFYVGYGIGTPEQVDPPLDNAQLSDKGLIGQVSLGVDYRLTDVFSIGAQVPLSYAYTLKQGAANDEDNYYQQFGASLLGYARVSLGVGK